MNNGHETNTIWQFTNWYSETSHLFFLSSHNKLASYVQGAQSQNYVTWTFVAGLRNSSGREINYKSWFICFPLALKPCRQWVNYRKRQLKSTIRCFTQGPAAFLKHWLPWTALFHEPKSWVYILKKIHKTRHLQCRQNLVLAAAYYRQDYATFKC